MCRHEDCCLALTDAERSRVVSVERVALPSQFASFLGDRRMARDGGGIVVFVAALVTLDDGQQRVVGLACARGETSWHCPPTQLTWWRDGEAPPPFGPDAARG